MVEIPREVILKINRRFGWHLSITVAFLLVLNLLFAPASAVRAAGTISLSALNIAYTEDFNTLASAGTANTDVPNGWVFAESGTNPNTTYRAGTGSDNAGDTYSFGAAGNAERAFGGLRSGSQVPLIGAQFANNTGGTITSLAISYTGEQWRLGQNATGRSADRLDFQLSVDATSLTTGTWTNYDTLDFSSPVIAGTVGALNGNAVENRTAVSFTITGLSIPNGASFWVRWEDSDLSPGADDGLSVDDFSLNPDGIPDVFDAAPEVSGTSPVEAAADVVVNQNIQVTFNEPVNFSDTSFSLTCSVSGGHPAGVSGGPAAFTLDPQTDFTVGDFCTLTVLADGVTDLDTNDGPDAMAADFILNFSVVDVCALDYIRAYAIQGSGTTAAITGIVTTQGVVVGDYEGPSPTLRGFFLQDLSGDGDAATSDAVFVFNGNNNSVNLGDVVRVTGTASDFQDQTQVSSTSINNCGTGSVAPTDVSLPFASLTDAERFEGMLVRLPQTLYVTEHFQLGRFGQVLLSADARLQQPTNVTAPGAPAQALQAQNDLSQILVDDASQAQNPDPILFGRGGAPLSASNTLRGGDTATGIVGVMTYTWAGNSASGNAFRVRPVNALGGSILFEPVNLRPDAAPALTGRLRVGGMNVLNFFNTFDGLPDNVDNCTNGEGGAPTDCRGADVQLELDRQWPKTVQAILGTQADVIGLTEIENDGYDPDSALQFLVNKLNEATAPGTYAFIDADAGTEQVNALGLDAIKVALIYKPAKVFPVGSTAALNTVSFVNGGDSAPRNRAALAQAFEEVGTGARFVVAVNHLKSKGSGCDAPDAGDGQGNCNQVRLNAANELAAWLAADPTGTNDPDVLIIGDLNSYAMEDPITALLNAGYTNLVNHFGGSAAYSYVFDGQWGYLDHALSNASLTPQVTGVAEWHINSDEPSVLDYNTDFKTLNLQAVLYAPDEFRIADHDPILVDLNLTPRPLTPNAGGFLTGGGSIVSPAGAYAVDPSLSGKATFGLEARYKKGKLLPEGNITFQFHPGAWKFSATSLEWLVINQSRTLAQLQGSGSINGAGTYTFRLWAGDGNPDTFRLKIWAQDGSLFYDNGALRPTSGGNIAIHK